MAQFVFNPLLTEFTIQKGVGEFGTGVALAPLVRSDSITGVYGTRERQNTAAADVVRAPGAKYKRTETTERGTSPYLCKDHGIIVPVPIELSIGQGGARIFEEKRNAALESVRYVQFSHEKQVHDLLWSSVKATQESRYGASQVVVPSVKWNASNDVMIQNVKDLASKIRRRCGYKPNTMVLPNEVADVILGSSTNSIAERLKYTSRDAYTADILARLFEVQRVIIPNELNNTANAGQDQSYADLWTGDNVGLFYIDTTDSFNKTTLASTFYWEAAEAPFFGTSEKYDDESNSHLVKTSAYFDVKSVDYACGGILWDVLT